MDMYKYRLIRFIFVLLCLVPSTICFLFVFFFLLTNRELSHKRLHNHVILVLLFCHFILITTELPIALVHSYQGHVQPQNDQFCSFWVAYNYGLYSGGLFLMAFASIERYFLIFHERYVHQWRFILHYPPIIICFIYPLLFYNILVNIYPCENIYDYDAYVCEGACYQFEALIGTLDYITNVFSPTVLIILATIILLIRVIYQKRSMKLANTWRKNRLMYVQLLSISMLYFFIWIPFVTVSLIRLFYDPLFWQDVAMLLFNYCLYICPLASPFISLIGLPTVRQHLTRNGWALPWINRNAVNRIRLVATVHTRTVQQQIVSRRQYDEHAF